MIGRAIALAALGFVVACSSSPGDADRRLAAGAIVTTVIVPTLDDVVARAATLSLAVGSLADAPTSTSLDAAQDAWRAARTPWKEADGFAFGPATDLRLGVAIDQFPIDPTRIDEEIAGTAELTEPYVENLGANRKGFHALEYVLFAGLDGNDDATVLAKLTTEPLAERRRALLRALAANLAAKTVVLRDAWTGGYGDALGDPGSATSYPTVKSAIDALVNEQVFVAELIARTRIGKPLGVESSGVPLPELEESGPSDNSIADMLGTLHSLRNIYTGTRDGSEGTGIGGLVATRGAATDGEVRELITAAETAIAAIPRPYKTALVDHGDVVTAAHVAVKELKRILATEVVAVLGATLSFNDNDGD